MAMRCQRDVRALWARVCGTAEAATMTGGTRGRIEDRGDYDENSARSDGGCTKTQQ